jgi:signal transduction histidine kinase/ligand-binding sensor domain-containing protein
MLPSLACLIRAGLPAGVLLVLGSSALGSPALASGNWFERSWQTDEGLPDNTVVGVTQTPDGFLWLATAGGLVRFDGARFEEFPIANLEGIPNRVVRTIMKDHLGRLWLQTDRGPVVCLEPALARTFTPRHGLQDSKAAMMAEDTDGAIWIAYANGGLARIRDDAVYVFGAKDGFPSGGSCSVVSDPQGEIWFAKGRRVGVFREGKFNVLTNVPESTTRVGAARKGGVWICAGLRLLKLEEDGPLKECAKLSSAIQELDPRVVFEDSSGAVWIGTAAHGLFRYDGVNLELAPSAHPEIWSVSEDREGNIWVGTGGGGLNRLRPRTIELVGAESGLPFESLRSVCEDRNGTLWAATQNGLLARRETGEWITVTRQLGWPGGHVNCLVADRQGAVWIGTRDRGLLRFDDGHYTSWRRSDGLASDSVRSILAAANGAIWIASDGPSRLQRLADGDLRTVEIVPRSRSIRALAEDAHGVIWAGTSEGRLFSINQNLELKEFEKPVTHSISIRCLCPTSDGSLWIGYAGWGLGWLKDGRLTRISASQGLNDDYISQILDDNRGWLWLAGNHGIFQVKIKELEAVGVKQLERVRSILYAHSEGVPNLQANYDSAPGATRTRNGDLWFAMRTGLAVVHTRNIRDNPNPPPVLIERVSVDGIPVARYDGHSPLLGQSTNVIVDLREPQATLRLGPGHRKVDFDFTALSFTAVDNVHFRYRLDNVDSDWNEISQPRSVGYNRLPAGDYTFRVQACNNAGVWNLEGAHLALIVAPFFWQTWTFRGATLAAFTLGLIALVRYVSFRRLRLRLGELEQQAALHKERGRIAKDIHDDLGASLTQIALLGELARQDTAEPEKAADRVGKISATARQAIKSLDEIVWAVNPRNDTLAHLIDYAGQFALDYLRLAGIRCRLDFPEQPPAREISTDIRHNLFLALKEALNNIVKHAHAREVWLRATADEQLLRFTIEDDGCGFDRAPEDALADGLRNMRQRLTEIGGQCVIGSKPGAGTKVTFELPWPHGRD